MGYKRVIYSELQWASVLVALMDISKVVLTVLIAVAEMVVSSEPYLAFVLVEKTVNETAGWSATILAVLMD